MSCCVWWTETGEKGERVDLDDHGNFYSVVINSVCLGTTVSGVSACESHPEMASRRCAFPYMQDSPAAGSTMRQWPTDSGMASVGGLDAFREPPKDG